MTDSDGFQTPIFDALLNGSWNPSMSRKVKDLRPRIPEKPPIYREEIQESVREPHFGGG